MRKARLAWPGPGLVGWLVALGVSALMLGCNLDLSGITDTGCVCAPGTCGYNECGEQCSCENGKVCGADLVCVDQGICDDTCDQAGWECGELCGEKCGDCGANQVCRDGSCSCEPQCDGLTCGDDGCGGTCSCPTGFACNDGKCIADPLCTDTCETVGWECDGMICGEACGPCAANEACEDHQCVCVPRCEGNACGSDGCGGTCPCSEGFVCDGQGACVEDPNCTTTCSEGGWQCGELCGNYCGTCPDGYACNGGQCECEPRCDGTSCDDGCGGTCPCGDGEQCDKERSCVDEAGCLDTCSGAGFECGELCGRSCGSCKEGLECRSGRCECQPSCDGTSCDDGCGGTCPCATGTVCDGFGQCKKPSECHNTCASLEFECGSVCGETCGNGSCSAGHACNKGLCEDQTSVLDFYLSKKEEAGGRTALTFGLKYDARGNDVLPRMADIRIGTDKAVSCDVDGVIQGPAVNSKKLYEDPVTGEPYRFRPDGSIQMLIYAKDNVDGFQSGHVLWLKLTCDIVEPVKFHLVHRHGILAPFQADVVLQQTAYDRDITVTK